MSASVSFFPALAGQPNIKASSTFTRGAPLVIEIADADGKKHGEVTVFTGSFAMTAALVDAINGVADRFAPETFSKGVATLEAVEAAR